MSTVIENKLGGRQVKAGLGELMRPKVILSLLVIGIFAFGALVTLSGFAGDLRGDNNGRAHALSNSAIGYAGIVELLRASDIEVVLDRTKGNTAGYADTLHIVTLTDPYQMPEPDDFDEGLSILIVMPKWRVLDMKEQSGWVKQMPAPMGPTYYEGSYNAALGKWSDEVSMRRIGSDDGTLVYDLRSNERVMPDLSGANIRHLQTLHGDGIIPVIRANGKAVLARLEDTSIYILSDPDILNTMGIAQKSRARYGRDMVSGLMEMEATSTDYLIFDLYVHGFGKTQNLIKILLTPPFLAATLCLLAAGGLVAWQAFARFGDPLQEERDYALGKYTLADNGARFIRIAGKETGMAKGYRDLLWRQAALEFHMEKQSADKIGAFLEGREKNLDIDTGWQDLSRRLTTSADAEDFLVAAQDLHAWRQEIIDDRK